MTDKEIIKDLHRRHFAKLNFLLTFDNETSLLLSPFRASKTLYFNVSSPIPPNPNKNTKYPFRNHPDQVHNISPRFLPNQINKLGMQKGQTEFEEVVKELLKESYTLHTDNFILNILKTRMFKDTNYEKTRQQPLKSQMS